MLQYSTWDDIRFFSMGEAMGMQRRDNSLKIMPPERIRAAAENAAPSVEAFGLPKYREAFILGFERGYNYIEIRDSMMRSAETYGTQYE